MQQRTQWELVIEIFNRRFFVPFKLEVKNKASVVLGDSAPSLGFIFREEGASAEIERDDLLQVLSTGEKKALYILNVIFEVEIRKQAQTPTVFVVDDIADSFDYKNKYAIIQYLQDIEEESSFRQIILTHNFDFFRTVQSRFVRYSHCLMVQREESGLKLVPAAGIKNLFLNDWKLHFFSEPRKRVAAIAFIRNIVEYTIGENTTGFELLTSLLHWKDSTGTITHEMLDQVYGHVFADGQRWAQPSTLVVETILAEAQSCLAAPEGMNFENKIVLAIAIRLVAEKYMIEKISDPEFVRSIGANQTVVLLKRLRKRNLVTGESLATLDEVALMTPENIHLNSFMYEPIVDMSDQHLRVLYRRVGELR
jgi:ABC-type cobalamin/Fe3+-siderophores transport system ATPase subunit